MTSKYIKTRQLHLCFFKSTILLTLIIKIAGCLLLHFLQQIDPETYHPSNYIVCFPFGLFFDLAYKELSYKEVYYFYYNQGIRKTTLWLSSFCCWEILILSIFLIIRLCANALK